MADAPEVVPSSWNTEQTPAQPSTVSPLSQEQTLEGAEKTLSGDYTSEKISVASPLNSNADTYPNEKKTMTVADAHTYPNEKKPLPNINVRASTSEKEALVTADDDLSPKIGELKVPETEETNQKIGYEHDDRAGSGLEPMFVQDAKTGGGDGNGTARAAVAPPQQNGYYPQRPTDQWHFGFWDICNPAGLCMESIFCPCVLTGRTHGRLHDPDNPHLSTTNLYCAGCCGLSFMTLGILPLFCFMTSAQRREIRYRYNIQGNNGADCLLATFCVCCALVQEEKEVVWREEQRKLASSQAEQMGKREDVMTYNTPSP